MNTFTIGNASYNGSSTDSNPLVWIHGTCNGKSAGYRPIYWAAIQQSFAANGTAGVQAVLGPLLLSCITVAPFPPIPAFRSSNICNTRAADGDLQRSNGPALDNLLERVMDANMMALKQELEVLAQVHDGQARRAQFRVRRRVEVSAAEREEGNRLICRVGTARHSTSMNGGQCPPYKNE